MNNWEKKRLDNCADVRMGQSPDSSSYNEEEEGLPFLQGCAEFGTKYPTHRIYTSQVRRVAPANSILISVRAPVGTLNFSKQDYCIGRGLGSIKSYHGDLDTWFLYYYIEQNVKRLEKLSQGSTFEAINSNDLKSLVVDLPILPERRKIAKILQTVDGQLEKTEAIIAKYKAIKQGLMQDLFTRGIDMSTGKLRPRYQNAPELYKSSPLGMIPKDWTPCKLEEIFEKLINGGTPPTTIPHYWQGKIPWITGADFLESFEIGEIRRYVNHKAVRETSTNIIPKGNILLVTRTGVGKLALAPTDIAVSQDITGIILKPEKVNTEYFFYQLQLIVEDLKKLNQGTSINGIIREDLISYETAYPKKDEQNRIASVLKCNDELLNKELENLSKLSMLKKGLMADLLSGKVRVQVNEEAVC